MKTLLPTLLSSTFLFFCYFTSFAQVNTDQNLVLRYSFDEVDINNFIMEDLSDSKVNAAFSDHIWYDDDRNDLSRKSVNLGSTSAGTENTFIAANTSYQELTDKSSTQLSAFLWVYRASIWNVGDPVTLFQLIDKYGKELSIQFDPVAKKLSLVNKVNGQKEWEVINPVELMKDDKWHHLGFTLNTQTNKIALFYEGHLTAELNAEIHIPNNPMILFGKDRTKGLMNYSMCIDDFSMYDVAVREEVVETLAELKTTNVVELSQEALKIFPNPVGVDQIQFKSDQEIQHVIISDQLGRQILSVQPSGQTILVDRLPQGQYFAQFILEDNSQVVRSFQRIK